MRGVVFYRPIRKSVCGFFFHDGQNFRIRPEWTEEVADIPEKTCDIYDFPYDRVADINDTFDI